MLLIVNPQSQPRNSIQKFKSTHGDILIDLRAWRRQISSAGGSNTDIVGVKWGARLATGKSRHSLSHPSNLSVNLYNHQSSNHSATNSSHHKTCVHSHQIKKDAYVQCQLYPIPQPTMNELMLKVCFTIDHPQRRRKCRRTQQVIISHNPHSRESKAAVNRAAIRAKMTAKEQGGEIKHEFTLIKGFT